MKKIIFVLAFLSINAFATTERTNDICFKGWKYASFELSSTDSDNYIVTKGQPFSGIDPKYQPSEKNCFAVRSGRSGSKKVLKWLNDKYASKEINAAPIPAIKYTTRVRELPEDANFGIYGTLILKNKLNERFECDDVLIGQSSTFPGLGSYNVWFIYPTTKDYLFKCKDQNGANRTIEISEGTHWQPSGGGKGAMSIPEDDNAEMGISAVIDPNIFNASISN
jgi:hypothetical protein